VSGDSCATSIKPFNQRSVEIPAESLLPKELHASPWLPNSGRELPRSLKGSTGHDTGGARLLTGPAIAAEPREHDITDGCLEDPLRVGDRIIQLRAFLQLSFIGSRSVNERTGRFAAGGA